MSAPSAAAPTASPAGRDGSRRPAARPPLSADTLLSVRPAPVGLDRPVPIIAIIAPGNITAQLESTVAQMTLITPIPTSVSPTTVMARGEYFAPMVALRPANAKFRIVPGM